MSRAVESPATVGARKRTRNLRNDFTTTRSRKDRREPFSRDPAWHLRSVSHSRRPDRGSSGNRPPTNATRPLSSTARTARPAPIATRIETPVGRDRPRGNPRRGPAMLETPATRLLLGCLRETAGPGPRTAGSHRARDLLRPESAPSGGDLWREALGHCEADSDVAWPSAFRNAVAGKPDPQSTSGRSRDER